MKTSQRTKIIRFLSASEQEIRDAEAMVMPDPKHPDGKRVQEKLSLYRARLAVVSAIYTILGMPV